MTIRRVETVFTRDVGFDPVKLVDSVRGRAGNLVMYG